VQNNSFIIIYFPFSSAPNLIILFYFSGAGDRTQDLAQARQALYS
jgi:hypothetical protein